MGSLIALSAGNRLGRRTEMLAAAVLYGAWRAVVLVARPLVLGRPGRSATLRCGAFP
jgi:hypothetical protein